jgi:protein O-mannosyl-transferase
MSRVEEHSPPPPRWLPALVLAVVAATYLPTLGVGFVWDDIPLVVQNQATGDLANIPQFFTMDLWAATPGQDGGTGYYRPLMLLSLALERAVYGLWPGGHHVQNVLWHVLGTAGLMALARPRLGAWGAVVAGLVFGLHPMQSEAVIWVAARNDPMATALGLWALERASAEAPSRRRMLVAFVLTALAGLAKESVVLLPGILLALDLMQRRRPRLARYLPIVAGLGLVLALRIAVGVDGAGLPQAVGWELLMRELHRFGGLLLTRASLPWPLHNGASLEWLPTLPVWRWAVGWVALGVALVGVAHRARRGDLRPAAGLVWFALAVAPVVIPVADKGLIGERYLYLALGGLAWGLGAGAGARRAALFGALAIPAIITVQLRIPDWQDDRSLWEAAVRTHPTPYTWGGLGLVLLGEGEPAEAYSLFIRALDDPRPDPSVCASTMRAAARLGRAGLLTQTGAWAARRGCDDADFRGERGIGLLLAGEWDSARGVAADVRPRAASGVVLAAALAVHDADPAALAEARADPAAPSDLDVRVEDLLAAPARGTVGAGGSP